MKPSRGQMRLIYDEVKQNYEKLNNCKHHKFKQKGEQRKFQRKYRCMNCDGVIDSISYKWFMTGYEMGKEIFSS